MFLYAMSCCILSKFYIKPQQCAIDCIVRRVVSYRNSTSNHNDKNKNKQRNVVVSYRNSTSNHNLEWTATKPELLYLIEILHQTTTRRNVKRSPGSLYLIEILHQTTTIRDTCQIGKSCILSKFYIKPQRSSFKDICFAVVSYRNSTSNHNDPDKM